MGRENRMNAVNEISVPPHFRLSYQHKNVRQVYPCRTILLTYQKLTSYVYVYMLSKIILPVSVVPLRGGG